AFVTYTGLAYTGALEPDRLATTQVDSIRLSELPPAAAPLAVLRRGDRIVTVNGDSVTTWGELLEQFVTASSPVRLGVAGRSEPIVLEFAPGDTTERFKLARGL